MPILSEAQVTPVIKWSYDTQSAAYGNAAAGDIDQDGKYEIVFGCYRNDGHIYALNAEDGSLLWKYDATVPGTDQGCNDVAVLIQDVDGDGIPEVIVPSSCYARTFCFNGPDGSLKWVTPTRGSDSPPVAVDFGAGSGLEILHGEFQGWVRSINALTGMTNWDFQVQTNAWVQTAPSILDIDNDGELDFVVATWAFDKADNHISAYRGSDQTLLWRHYISDVIYHGSAIGDIDQDGYEEIIIGSWNDTLYCLDSRTGEPKWTYYVGPFFTPYGPAVIADMDKDGQCDIVVSTWYTISVLDAAGNLKWDFQDLNFGYSFRGVTVADINDDGYPDIIYGTSQGILSAIDGFTRQKLFDLDLRAEYGDPRFELDHAPLIADFDGDGNLDIFIAGGYGVYPKDDNFGRAYLIGVGPGEGPDWLMFQQDPWRRSNVCDVKVTTLSPRPVLPLHLSPNPAREQVHIRFGTDIDIARISLQLYDVAGRAVAVNRSSYQTDGDVLIWNIDTTLPGGVYFLQVQATDRIATEKVILLR